MAFRAALVAAVAILLPGARALASTPDGAGGILSERIGCLPTVRALTGTAAHLSRVRAAAPSYGGAAVRRDRSGRDRSRESARPAPKRSGAPIAAAPRSVQDARPPVLSSFYACQAAVLPDLAEGTGWKLVGPLRQG